MKDNYFVIKSNGQIEPAQSYHQSGHGSRNFRLLMQREALHQGVNRGADGQPAYLSVAKNSASTGNPTPTPVWPTTTTGPT